jgi:ribosomal protein S18 acetylase RimI-like enzyme
VTDALRHPGTQTARGRGLQATHLVRDLYQIAELVELCFGSRLDSSGRAAVREMKMLARLGPLFWLLALLDRVFVLGLGQGYVWREGGRVVGNVSLYRGGLHPDLGSGWLIANVAVHPDYRRRGIARKLMNAAMSYVRQRHCRWVMLQVEADNAPALRLYRDLAYQAYETLDQWMQERPLASRLDRLPGPSRLWPVRRRQAGDAEAERALIFRRARRGGMTWTHPLTTRDLRDSSLSPLLMLDRWHERWVLPDPADPQRLLGAAWIRHGESNRTQLSFFLDPALQDPEAVQALFLHMLRRPGLRGRALRLETADAGPLVDKLLSEAGFRRTRQLVQMRFDF